MYKLAKKIHNENIVIDSHLDLGGIIYNRVIEGHKKILNELFLDDFRTAGVSFVVAAIFIETVDTDMALKMGLLQIQMLKNDIKECTDFMLVQDDKDMEKALEEGKIGIIISLEGLEPILREITLLDTFYDLGVRGFGLTWSRRNYVADGSYFGAPEEGTLGGLTPFGIKVVRRADELGMFMDLSHINDAGFSDVLKYTDSVVFASHSNVRELNKLPRNLSDDQIKSIGERGGIIGINAYKSLVSEEKEEQTVEKMCDHIDYMVELTSDKNVGFGFDLCNKYYVTSGDSDTIKDHSESVLITAELLKRGYSEDSVKNIIGLNFYNYLSKKLSK